MSQHTCNTTCNMSFWLVMLESRWRIWRLQPQPRSWSGKCRFLSRSHLALKFPGAWAGAFISNHRTGGVGKNVANANNFGGTGGTLETERLGSAIKHMVAVARSILFFLLRYRTLYRINLVALSQHPPSLGRHKLQKRTLWQCLNFRNWCCRTRVHVMTDDIHPHACQQQSNKFGTRNIWPGSWKKTPLFSLNDPVSNNHLGHIHRIQEWNGSKIKQKKTNTLGGPHAFAPGHFCGLLEGCLSAVLFNHLLFF